MRGTVVQAALDVCCTRERPRGSGAIQLQTRRIAPIRKRVSRQSVEFQIGESPVGTPRADKSLTSRWTTVNPPKHLIHVWGNAPRRSCASTRRK
jgi:hypothetical protein